MQTSHSTSTSRTSFAQMEHGTPPWSSTCSDDSIDDFDDMFSLLPQDLPPPSSPSSSRFFFSSNSPELPTLGRNKRRPTVTFDLMDVTKALPLTEPSPAAKVASKVTLSERRHDDTDQVDNHPQEQVQQAQGYDRNQQEPHSHHGLELGQGPLVMALAQQQALSPVPPSQVPALLLALDETETEMATTSEAVQVAAARTTLASAVELPQQQQQQQQESEVDLDQTMMSPTAEAILDHILTTTQAPSEMLVALFDRAAELEILASINSAFFSVLKDSVAPSCRTAFQGLLVKPRQELTDKEWMNQISDHLRHEPCILQKFKEIVGWVGIDHEDDDGQYGDEDDEFDGHEAVYWGEDEYGCRDSSFDRVDIRWLRERPDCADLTLDQMLADYPVFFSNALEALGDKDLYATFCEALAVSRDRQAMDDRTWYNRMMTCLDPHPDLLLQFKEIVAYEVGHDV